MRRGEEEGGKDNSGKGYGVNKSPKVGPSKGCIKHLKDTDMNLEEGKWEVGRPGWVEGDGAKLPRSLLGHSRAGLLYPSSQCFSNRS